MKIIIIVCVLLVSGLLGYMIKLRYKEQTEFLQFIKNFIDYTLLNIGIYKNNLNDIINNYIIQQNNKSAKYIKIFQKSNNLYYFDLKNINEYVADNCFALELKSFFNNLGKFDKDNEIEKIKNMLLLLNGKIQNSEIQEKEKGDLYFKLALAVGIVISVIIW